MMIQKKSNSHLSDDGIISLSKGSSCGARTSSVKNIRFAWCFPNTSFVMLSAQMNVYIIGFIWKNIIMCVNYIIYNEYALKSNITQKFHSYICILQLLLEWGLENWICECKLVI